MDTKGQPQTMPVAGTQTTISQLLRQGTRVLAESSESARLDAELLLGHVLDAPRVQLFTRHTEPVDAEAGNRYLQLIEQRRHGHPVAQLLGEREFWSMPIQVTADTLIPRPETELLVLRALARISSRSPGSVLELGTGSGAVALSIAVERPGAAVTATDISAAALEVARHNSSLINADNIDWRRGHWFDPVENLRFDIIVSNPPYVGTSETGISDRELAHEPALALYAGPDGLDAITEIVAGAGQYLEPGGWLLLEHGYTQGATVRALLRNHGFASIASYDDLSGQPRVTEACRHSNAPAAR